MLIDPVVRKPKESRSLALALLMVMESTVLEPFAVTV